MNVLVVEPGILPYEKEISGLRDMQEIVGGTITASYPFEDMAAIVSNYDSIGLGMPFNRSIEGGYGGIFGTFFVCGLGSEDFISLTPEQMEVYKQKYKRAEILIGIRGETPITLKVEALPKVLPGKEAKGNHSPER